MISKCQNIVINRTKFSEFYDYDVNSLSTSGLKIVGYIEPTDQNSVESTKNVAIDYSALSEVNIVTPDNYFVPALENFTPVNNYMIKEMVRFESRDVEVYRITSDFEGTFIQFNLGDSFDPVTCNNIFSNDREGYKTLYISFDKKIPFGREIKVLFKNFPMYIDDSGAKFAIRLINYGKVTDIAMDYHGENLIESDEYFKKDDPTRNILISFVQSANSSASSADNNNRFMSATNTEIVYL